MRKAIIFGAGELGREIHKNIYEKYKVVCFIDNHKNRQGTELFNLPVYSFDKGISLEYDYIFIGSTTGFDSMKAQLIEVNVPENKIIDTFSRDKATLKRKYLYDFSTIVLNAGLPGNVAEAGVFQGEYAKYINEYFPNRTLYLFDTFEGFDERDKNDSLDEFKDGSSLYDSFGYLNMTSVKLVLSKMKTPDKCIVKKGYFPQTAEGIEDSFIFVSLDMDLYQPTLEGLRFFYPKLVDGGIIMMDDYFSFKGIQKAVKDFFKENPSYTARLLPVGDGDNLVICK